MVKVRNQNEDDSLNIGYIDNHFKLAKTCHWNVNFPNICNMNDDIINKQTNNVKGEIDFK
jgi:hypothetical protein